MTVDLILVMASSEQGPYLLERKEPMDKWSKTDVESVAEINLYDVMNHIRNRGNFTKHWNEIYPPYCEGKLHQIGMPLFSFLWVLYDSVAFFRFHTTSPSNQDTHKEPDFVSATKCALTDQHCWMVFFSHLGSLNILRAYLLSGLFNCRIQLFGEKFPFNLHNV